MSINCEKCGKEISTVLVDEFLYDGSDQFLTRPIIEEKSSNAVVISASPNWVCSDGALLDEDLTETIQCPHCGKFPFKDESVQVYPTIQLVCFKKKGGKE